MNESDTYLSPREQQIMEAIYRAGNAGLTATGVQEALLPEQVGNSAVRTFLRILEEKKHLRHIADGTRFVYLPTRPTPEAAQSALSRVVRTFFADSPLRAALTLLSPGDANQLTAAELDALQAVIDAARQEGR
ncbi:MAG: BlaI/MecI/CopY family transcriptional regulator [Fibrella sp.]|nr:BlaI/MecI/CopY family transcriptional regulator [Armatimonadota bacterium]